MYKYDKYVILGSQRDLPTTGVKVKKCNPGSELPEWDV